MNDEYLAMGGTPLAWPTLLDEGDALPEGVTIVPGRDLFRLKTTVKVDLSPAFLRLLTTFKKEVSRERRR